jgi:ribulose-5-phosphate 4-epimerase/fuculose-1-phosphate aldolase
LFIPGDFEGQLHLRDVPVVAQGDHQVAQVATALQNRLAVVLQGHGAYARGADLWEALHWITALEESAHIEVIRRSVAR